MNKHAESEIRQLCALGLEPHYVVQKLLDLLHKHIPSYANLFIWVDDNQDLHEIYAEEAVPFHLLPHYQEEFQNTGDIELFDGWSGLLKHPTAAHLDELLKVERGAFLKHSFYNEILKQMNFHWGLQRRIQSRGKTRGALQIYRGQHDRDFTAGDVTRLEQLAVHLEYAFSVPKYDEVTMADTPSNVGFVFVNNNGEVNHYSPGAEHLAILAREESIIKHDSKNESSWFASIAKVLSNNLLALSNGAKARPPALMIRNKWGEFSITAFFLHSPNGAERQIAMKIEHYLPSPLVMLSKLENQKLTSRQKEICIEIGMGRSYEDIAVRMGIALSTVVSHKKEIFDRLEVKNRHELVRRILY